MKFIITEEQNIKLQVLRRLDEIWDLMNDTYPFQYPCDYHSLGAFTIELRREVFHGLDLDWFDEKNEPVIWDIIVKLLGKRIKGRYDDADCDGESVIEESDNQEQKRWLRFEMFMRRRGEQISDIISQHSHAYQYDVERHDEDVLMSTMLDLVVGDFCDINKIDYEDKEYDWVYLYIKDNYTDYIKKDLGILDKDTITEEQENKFKKDKWCKHIEDIVLSMDIKRLCGVQVRAMDNTFGDDESFRHYLVILETHTRGTEFETKVRLHINDFLPHLDVIVITLPCDTSIKITENTDRKKQLNKLFRRINPQDLIYHLDLTIYNEIEWHMRDKNVIPLEKLGETEFVYLVIEHLWEYIYDAFVESNVTYRDDEILEIKGGIQSLFGDRIRNVYHKAVEKNTNMNLKENIRRVLREEEKKKDLSVPIKKLVDLYMEKHEDKKYVCGYKFGMGKFAVKNSGERYQRFKITILFNSGYGSKRWPRTMAINTQEEEIMNELQDLILDTFGVIVDMYSTQTPNCKVEDIEKGEQTEGEITEKCWSGYTQKGMKTMFGKRYPNCVKKTK